jgi:hypothetical protein
MAQERLTVRVWTYNYGMSGGQAVVFTESQRKGAQ